MLAWACFRSRNESPPQPRRRRVALEELNVLDVQFAGARLVVRVDVRHQRVARAVDALADDAAVLLLPFGVLVGNVALQRGFRAQHFAAQLAREQLLGREAWNIETQAQPKIQYTGDKNRKQNKEQQKRTTTTK